MQFHIFLAPFFLLLIFSRPQSLCDSFAPVAHRADDIQCSTMESDMFAQQWRSTISALSSARQKVFVIAFAAGFFLEKKQIISGRLLSHYSVALFLLGHSSSFTLATRQNNYFSEQFQSIKMAHIHKLPLKVARLRTITHTHDRHLFFASISFLLRFESICRTE